MDAASIFPYCKIASFRLDDPRMSSIRILAGDFRSGRAEFDGIGLSLHSGESGREYVKVSQIRELSRLEREWRSGLRDKMTGLAAGGVVGGIAAGAMAGGLTGPAGAVVGAIAGAFLAGRRFETHHVTLVDGRRFVAVGSDDTWGAIRKAAELERAALHTACGAPSEAKSKSVSSSGRIRRQLPSFRRHSSSG